MCRGTKDLDPTFQVVTNPDPLKNKVEKSMFFTAFFYEAGSVMIITDLDQTCIVKTDSDQDRLKILDLSRTGTLHLKMRDRLTQ